MTSILRKHLASARQGKNDEFYTQLSDIEKELSHYKEQFTGKVVFCNCDDPDTSKFWQYFSLNFEFLGLKKLVATHFEIDKPSYKLEITNTDGVVQTPLKQNGDFRSPECIEILKEANIVVTNPPFSLFREYVAQLMEHQKQFAILGNVNAITYKDTFQLIKEDKLWLGNGIYSGEFRVPEHYPLYGASNRIDDNGNKYIKVKGVRWFTNLDVQKRHEDLILYKEYSPEEFPTYDNYEAINVDKTNDIPCDYKGVMGVPITFLDKYNPEQFEILGNSNVRGQREHLMNNVKSATNCTYINGKPQYARILIRNKKL